MFDNLLVRGMLVIGCAANLGIWAAVALAIRPQDNPIFLHYNIYFGVDLIGPWYQMYALPAVGLVSLVINVLVARYLYRKNTILGLLVLGIAVYLELLLFLATILIVRQNIL